MLGHIGALGHVESDKDVQTVSELMDEIRDAVTDYQVSGDTRFFPHVFSFEQNWLDGDPTGHIQAEPQTDCESQNWTLVSISDSLAGSRLEFLQVKINIG